MKPVLPAIIVTSLLFIPVCSHHSLNLESIIYHPPVVFAGYVNDDYDSLPGNPAWPNTARLLGDTLRMYFYSGNFHVTDQIWNGDLLMLTLLPHANDTMISTRSVFLHMARYLDQNYTYEVVPGDSVDLSDYKVEMRALSLSRAHGSRIDIDHFTVQAKPLEGSASLVIHDGRISGTIQ